MIAGRLASLLVMAWVPVCPASNGAPGGMLATLPPFSAEHNACFSNPGLRHSSRESLLQAASGRGCEASALPQALATPDPLLDTARLASNVAVSFIVGTDGRVHSPVILESAGSGEDELVLETVRSWRYRPALCNAQPTETESRIEFSRR